LVLYSINQFVRHSAQVLRNHEVRFQYKTYVKRAVVSNAVVSMR